MNNEEAIENIKLIRFNAAITDANSFKEALDMAIEALSQQPSLPSNLDEAADCYKDTVTPEEVDDSEHAYSYETYTEYQIADAFKAGAEWMAGKFVLVGGEPTGWFRANDGSEYATGLDLKEPIKLPVDFYARKKD